MTCGWNLWRGSQFRWLGGNSGILETKLNMKFKSIETPLWLQKWLGFSVCKTRFLLPHMLGLNLPEDPSLIHFPREHTGVTLGGPCSGRRSYLSELWVLDARRPCWPLAFVETCLFFKRWMHSWVNSVSSVLRFTVIHSEGLAPWL